MQDPNAPFQHLRVDQVVASKTNPRKRFQEDKLQELADNIKLHGVMQPILVRPIDKRGQPVFGGTAHKYELVAGERRYRASKLAGEEFIPAVVRELHDLDALQLQVFENLHRDDLHPMEEAEGFQQLLRKSQDLIGLSVDELAAKVGKTRSYIYASLKLLALCPEGREAFFEGKLSQSTALLIARIPGEKLQKQAIKEITKPDWQGSLPSYRSAARTIQDRFTLHLDKAIFDIGDATLLGAAGACTDCPKRSGNCKDLCPDIESTDVCTDPDCFTVKREAHVRALKESGDQVLSGKEASKIAPGCNRWNVSSEYVVIDRQAPVEDDESRATYEELLGNDLPETITIIPENGEPFRVIKAEEAHRALEAKGVSLRPAPKNNADYAKEQARKKELAAALTARRQQIADRTLAAIQLAAINSPEATLLKVVPFITLMLAKGDATFYTNDILPLAHKHLGITADIESLDEDALLQDFEREVQSFSTGQTAALLADVVLREQVIVSPWRVDEVEDPDLIFGLAKAFGIDPTAPESETAPYPSIAAQADSPIAPAQETPLPFAEIKAKELARRERRGKKESADADGDNGAAGAATAASLQAAAA